MKSIIFVAYGTIYEMARVFYQNFSWEVNDIRAYMQLSATSCHSYFGMYR